MARRGGACVVPRRQREARGAWKNTVGVGRRASETAGEVGAQARRACCAHTEQRMAPEALDQREHTFARDGRGPVQK